MTTAEKNTSNPAAGRKYRTEPEPSDRMPPGIPYIVANEFAEATSDLHTSALIALGFLLFVITFIVLAVARLLLREAKV